MQNKSRVQQYILLGIIRLDKMNNNNKTTQVQTYQNKGSFASLKGKSPLNKTFQARLKKGCVFSHLTALNYPEFLSRN